MKYFYFIILTSFLVVSCKKKSLNFTISAYINDESFNKAISNFNLTITQVNVDGSLGKDLIKQEIITNNGNFEVTFKRDKALKYILRIEKENYFEFKEEINFSDLSTEIPLLKYYKLLAKSWIKFRIKNVFPVNNSDVYTLYFDEAKFECEECCNYQKLLFNGNIDSTIVCPFGGNITYRFPYIISSPLKQDKFEVKTVAFDTVSVDCFY
jgi:hypothetical protein